MRFKWWGTIIGAIATVTVCLMGLVSARAQAGQGTPRVQTSEQAFKNVQVLKGIPVDEFMDTMGMFSSALGLCCTDCHGKEAEGNVAAFAVETDKIRQARGMIAMMNTLNENFFGGDQRVTCFTCHRGGESVPETIPDLSVQYGEPREPSPNSMDIARSIRSAQPVFDKYMQALGGAQRVAALTSFTATGTYTGYETGMGPVQIQLSAKAPNQRAMVLKMPEEDGVRVFDGANGWVVGPEKAVPITTLSGPNLFAARMEAMIAFPAGIQREFTKWLTGSAVIDGNEMSVAQGSKDGQLPVSFYFDQSSGLLKRVVRWNATAVGAVPTQVEYDDYRAVAGVQLPFKIVTTWTNGQSTLLLSDVLPNVAIDAAKFGRPAPARDRQ